MHQRLFGRVGFLRIRVADLLLLGGLPNIPALQSNPEPSDDRDS